MASSDMYISNQEIRAGLIPAIEGLISPVLNQNLDQQISEQIAAGNSAAYYVPCVKFLLDATLGILEQQTVEERLSLEVTERQNTAVFVARNVVNPLAIKHGMYLGAYTKRPQLAAAKVGANEKGALAQATYTESIGAAPFYEASVIMGGVSRLLVEKDITEQPREVAKSSRALLQAARVHKGYTREVYKHFGAPPYIDTKWLKLIERTEKGPKVGFTQAAQQAIKATSVSGGCPAATVRNEAGQSMLGAYWSRLADFLLPDRHTTTAT